MNPPDANTSNIIASCADEENIVWLRDRESIAGMRYVREKTLLCRIRTGPVRAPPGEVLIGYAVLKKNAPENGEGGFYRRIFTLSLSEIDLQEVDGQVSSTPVEAVDPLAVQPGEPGRRLRG